MTDTQTAPSAPSTTDLKPAILVIFGVTGDLSRRYLLPSLYRLFELGLAHEQTAIIGVSRRDISFEEAFGSLTADSPDGTRSYDPAVVARIRDRARIHQLDMADPAAYAHLLEVMNGIENEAGICMDRLYYLSIPPEGYAQVITNMGQADLNGSCQHGSAQTRLLVEKPFGQDLASARTLVETTAAVFGEEQVFRIDHYLAKETVQNITTFRSHNPIFEAIWNRDHVSRIDIVASEKIGVEGRGNFYEGQGALRDVIQNHLLQLLAVATMDQPESDDSDAIHRAKLRLLEAVRPITAGQVAAQARRGQYAGYRDEVGNPQSVIETYAAIRTTIDTPRWQGVPVTIRTGKAMAGRYTCITFTFTEDHTDATNDLVFRIQPEEGISISLQAKKPGFEHELQDVHMDFSYAQHFDDTQPNAYERVLVDAIRGDRTRFASSQEVLASWQIVDEVIKAWESGDEDLQIYQPGTDIDGLSRAI